MALHKDATGSAWGGGALRRTRELELDRLVFPSDVITTSISWLPAPQEAPSGPVATARKLKDAHLPRPPSPEPTCTSKLPHLSLTPEPSKTYPCLPSELKLPRSSPWPSASRLPRLCENTRPRCDKHKPTSRPACQRQKGHR